MRGENGWRVMCDTGVQHNNICLVGTYFGYLGRTPSGLALVSNMGCPLSLLGCNGCQFNEPDLNMHLTENWLSQLAAGVQIDVPSAIVAAHPDDEIIGMGGRLFCLSALTLIHVTNGAGNSVELAKAKGFASPEDYSAARFGELDLALKVVGAAPQHCLRYAYADGEAALSIIDLTVRLARDLHGKRLIFTHAFEGGHPDHDTCAFATRAACCLIERDGAVPPEIIEFSGYHSRYGKFFSGEFWPDEKNPTIAASLSPLRHFRKRLAMHAFRSQSWIRNAFHGRREYYRHAPGYDFSRPPPGAWLYDKQNWVVTGGKWVGYVEDAIDKLGVEMGLGPQAISQ